MIVLYKGSRGRGKTLTMTKDAIDYVSSGWKLYSNMKLFGVKYSPITKEEILSITGESELRLCVIMIDEIQLLFDSRNFGRKENQTFSYFLQQIRKRKIIILATTQYTNTVELRFRQHIDYIAIPKYDEETGVCSVEYIDITTAEDPPFMVQPSLVKVYFFANEVFNRYDTDELFN